MGGAVVRLATLAEAFGLGLAGDFLPLIALDAIFLEAFGPDAFFLADACRFPDDFEDARPADRVFEPVRPGFPGAARLAALRLAIASVLSEP